MLIFKLQKHLICRCILLRKMAKFYLFSLLIVFAACKRQNSEPPDPNWTFHTDTVINLKIDEPSGLALSVNKDFLYTVSDLTGKIYRISFKGDILNELPFIGSDMEGIAVDVSVGEIYTVEEGIRRVDHLGQQGILIDNISSINVGNAGTDIGFEGIAKNRDTLYILFEKNPGLLIKYYIPTGNWTQIPLSFALDYSGIDYDESDSTLWIVSHESASLNHCDLGGNLIKSQALDIVQAEGVAVDRKRNVAWIVSDSDHKLHRIVLKI